MNENELSKDYKGKINIIILSKSHLPPLCSTGWKVKNNLLKVSRYYGVVINNCFSYLKWYLVDLDKDNFKEPIWGKIINCSLGESIKFHEKIVQKIANLPIKKFKDEEAVNKIILAHCS